MSNIEVVHIHATRNTEAVRVYIGRPSPLGNPFTQHDKETNIKHYRSWLKGQLNIGYPRVVREMRRLASIARHQKLELSCWCAPDCCHGDVIKEELENILKGE